MKINVGCRRKGQRVCSYTIETKIQRDFVNVSCFFVDSQETRNNDRIGINLIMIIDCLYQKPNPMHHGYGF